MAATLKSKTKMDIVATCQRIIKSYNPVTHSIDTHCAQELGDVTKPDASPDSVLVQQIVYGCFKEKPLLKKFIEDFYGDNASRVLRVDMTMYTILTYMAIYRIDEMGFAKFREIVMTQEPSKVSTFISYLFNKENLWNVHRSSWMEVKDLQYVEEKMIPRLEPFIGQMQKLDAELTQTSIANQAAAEAAQAAKDQGSVGLGVVQKKAATRPRSPRITKPLPPLLPEPEKISTEIEVQPMPTHLNRVTMGKLAKQREEQKKQARDATLAQYSKDLEFSFQQPSSSSKQREGSSHYKTTEEVRKQVEDQRDAELRFNSSYYNPPPAYQSKSAFRENAAAILREDALYRKQQEKDAQILRKYEEELRDPTEFYLWQADMRERDAEEKIKHVAMRRDQAKQSAIEAKYATQRQIEDNVEIASMVREQTNVIMRQRQLENEIDQLQKAERVQQVITERESKPLEAKELSLAQRTEQGKQVREELTLARELKAVEDREDALVKADRIRQLRALNSVHREHIVVFDPTQTAGIGLLDEMSYLEMKTRQKIAQRKEEEREVLKRQEIQKEKEKKSSDLQKRSESIQRARALKAAANRTLRENKLTAEKDEKEALADRRMREEEAWKIEQAQRSAEKKSARDALLAEEERIKRQQQYLGVAQGQVAIMRENQMQLARDRQVASMQAEFEEMMRLHEETQQKEVVNKQVLHRQEWQQQAQIDQERAESFAFEKQSSIQKIQQAVVYKKNMFNEGQTQHVRTRTVLQETNPYGTRISQELRTTANARRTSLQ